MHIPGKENDIADYMSRLQNENTEWRLFPLIFVDHLHISISS